MDEPGEATGGSLLEGRHVRLRAVAEADYESLYALLHRPEVIHRWRHRGVADGPEAFRRNLWDGVLCQFLIERLRDGEQAGIVSAFNADYRSQFAHVGVVIHPEYQRLLWPLEGFRLLVDYLFAVFPFRKLYAEMVGFNYAAVASLRGGVLQEEGRLVGHDFHDGEYHDLHILAIYRDQWLRLSRGGRPLRRPPPVDAPA